MMSTLGFRIALVAIVAEYTLSANVLAYFGVPYVDEGGSIIAKLHPGTYLSILAIIVHTFRNGDPLHAIATLAWHERCLGLFLGCIAICFVSAACLTGVGNLVTLLDTFLPAGLVAATLCDMTSQQTARLARIVTSVLLLSATIGIGEAATGYHLVPVVSAGPEQAAEFRSVGLYDHPLTAAAATMIGLLSSIEFVRTFWWRTWYQGWLLLALLAFGGRTALATTIVASCIMYLARLRRHVMARALRLVHFTPILVVGLAVVPLACFALAAGWGERLQRHIFWDASAQARIAQFHLLGLMSPTQLMFGCRRSDLLALIEPLRLAYGVDVIENFWLLHFATLGLFGFSAFAFAMAGMIAWLWQRCDTDGRVVLISLILVASTNNSLGRKSPLLVMLVTCLLARSRKSSAFAAAKVRPSTATNAAVAA